ncbi:hypothetical protein P170DRAFT_431213 [Aspergillus steynii IBT 23096]|uniref:F-box domain-containing protein n=1 Tax=Aspergillus steynii IBT 23096 TaxID=1392250 RepID=A0A2I2FRJ5_9EURO|nr:uncharacterized protein P170DRAFT_431213 [Aspergillus steynii IBT 23096]PLB43253.1 hypothetical protein P170DRAFT_431213 [Aspergillus steynii IBT 23096]
MSHPVSLVLLPVEILHMILAYLDNHSLYSLTRVCHYLQCEAECHLYKSILLRNQHGPGFVRAIERIPTRALHVRELKLHYHENIIEANPLNHYAQLISPTIGKLVNLKSLVLKDSSPMTFPAFFGLECDADVRKFEALILQSIKPYSSQLQNLQTCVLQFSTTEYCPIGKSDRRDAVFLLSHLKRLTIIGMKMTTFRSFRSRKSGTTALEELKLLSCWISPAILRKIISLPKALKHFTSGGDCLNMSGNRRWCPATNPDALQQQKDSLLSATLHFTFAGYRRKDLAQDFSVFSKLDTLEIAISEVPGVTSWWYGYQIKAFPPMLRSLRIFSPSWSSHQAFENAWVRNILLNAALSHLQVVIFEYRHRLALYHGSDKPPAPGHIMELISKALSTLSSFILTTTGKTVLTVPIISYCAYLFLQLPAAKRKI